ncbi:outer membrane protein with beta-barrel domain [Flavobacterium endophyticum]|uniref:Outer membrane protein with beta-barrel domain n=1 Tax=Flavobacterium endophyticum TaxID=1540163 RepID=A0A495MQS5_9FLAO|nr:porin family protein [Flavobacterium endophyticum]RKS26649.1 outer membrane protein with beta-barrel domain [Flavobacterium endophyticum]
MKKYFSILICIISLHALAQDPVKDKQIKEAQEKEEQERIKEVLSNEKATETRELEEVRRKKDSVQSTVTVVDSLYREDQFYIGLTYDLLQKRPDGVSQNSFSSGFHIGFLRDIPLNKRRNVAIAIGLGYSMNDYRQNIKITEVDGKPFYEVVNESEVNFDKNKFSLHYVDIPFEFRWRTSTIQSHRFWRVYTGFKLSYLLLNKSKYVEGNEKIRIFGNDDFNKLQYGAYISFGYNTWNFHAYYGLNSLFKSDAKIDGKSIDMNTVNIGLMFYIL